MPVQATDGAHIFVARPRVGVRINLHPVDVFNVAVQPDVLAAMTHQELVGLQFAVSEELRRRSESGQT